MRLGLEDYVTDIVQATVRECDGDLDASSARLISRPAGKETVRDATLALYVDGRSTRDNVVLLISNPSFPKSVGEDVTRAGEVAQLLTESVRRRVVRPLYQGVRDGLTYAVFPRLEPFPQARYYKHLFKARVSNKVIPWLAAVGDQTKHFQCDVSKCFLEPLHALCSDEHAPARVKTFAGECLTYASQNSARLFLTVEHGDFWVGNVLFQPSAIPTYGAFQGDFRVIDWRGSRKDGYPCIDAMRFCSSLFKAGARQSDALLEDYRGAVGLSRFEMGFYCMTSLGRLRMNLEEFPKERFYELASSILDYLEAHNLTQGAS